MSAHAATTIEVSTRVALPAVKRFGINLGWMNSYDSGQIMKNLVFRNPGFEGQIYRSIVRVSTNGSAPAPTATTFVDENNTTHWPSGFWNGATYEVIVGTAKGRSGSVSTSTAPANPSAAGIGTQYQLADSGVVPGPGDYIVLRKTDLSNAASGWLPSGNTADEHADLAPDSPGHQAIRLTAMAVGETARVATTFDTPTTTGPFVELNGTFRLSFKAKGLSGGTNNLAVFLGRGTPANLVFVNQTVALNGTWNTYNLDFMAGENGSSRGQVQLLFTAVNPSVVLLDDVSLIQTDSDPTNTTVFRDSVVNALKSFNPGILRYWVEDLGDSLDNEIAAPFARQRAGYSSQSTNRDDLMYGLHEFLELCDLLHAEPWFCVPTTFTSQDMTNLIEYLSGPAGTTYGDKRGARGRVAPWTDAFAAIHLEFGNEAWNNFNYYGGTIGNADPPSYGTRASEMFGIARGSAYFSASKFDLILGGHAANPGRNISEHNASTNHDSLAVAPYFGGNINNYSTNEELFGPLFAEPEMVEGTGYMRTNYNNIQGSTRHVPLAVYEVNLHTTDGTITQTALDSFTPSAGAGVAVADHMLIMLRDLGIRNQVLYSLTQYANSRPGPNASYVLLWGSVRDMGVTDRKRPQFLTVKLANEVLSGDMLQTAQSGDNPTWVQPALNGIPSQTTAHFIQSFAFLNGNRLAVIVFNLHRTSSLDVTFSGLNAPFGSVTMRRIAANAITDTNESAENVIIQTTNLTAFDPTAPLTLPPFSMSVLTSGDSAPAIPTGLHATAQSTALVSLMWDATMGATQYDVARMFNAGTWQTIATVNSPSYNDSVSAGTAYVYRVRAINAGGRSALGTPDVATTVMFTDDPIVAGSTVVRADHVTQLRNALNAVRVTAGITQQSWTDSPLVAQSTVIQATHVIELRNALIGAFSALGVPLPPFANTVAMGSLIHAADVQELRDAVR